MLGPDRFKLRDGYVFVSQDVRGRYMSGGTFVNVRPLLPDSVKAHDPRATDEATDTYDTIAWLLTRVAGNNGRVGLWGISYPGFYATLGLVSHHPALVAVSPQAPATDIYFEDFHHTGALVHGDCSTYPILGILRPAPTMKNWWLPEFQRLDAMAQPDDYQWQLSLGPVSAFAARFYPGNTFWNDIIGHPDYDDFWQARAPEPKLRGVTAAVLVVGGWFDGEGLYGPLSVYRMLRAYNPKANTSLVMGPFGHRRRAAPDDAHSVVGNLMYGDSLAVHSQRNVEAPFFHADASMSTTAPAAPGSFRAYASDPPHPMPTRCSGPTLGDYTLYMNDDQRCFDGRSDVLAFQTAPLTANVTVGATEHRSPSRSRSSRDR